MRNGSLKLRWRMIAYGDLIGGISGDMMVGALLDLGFPIAGLKAELGKLPSLKYRLEVTTKKLHAIRATRFRVLTRGKESERTWADIRRLIEQSALETDVKECGLKIFARLAEVEGKIHGIAPAREIGRASCRERVYVLV